MLSRTSTKMASATNLMARTTAISNTIQKSVDEHFHPVEFLRLLQQLELGKLASFMETHHFSNGGPF
jgi:hypothetical protein